MGFLRMAYLGRPGGRARGLRAVPRTVVTLLVVALGAQLYWHSMRPAPQAQASDLPPPPGLTRLRLVSVNDPLVMSRFAMLWLQAFDNQPGLSVPFAKLDYQRVEAWLDTVLALDNEFSYPLLAASRLYTLVPEQTKQRQMFEFVYRKFLEAPNERWPWLAHAAIVAKHGLKDLPLALRYAQAITDHAADPSVPSWARDMTVIILEEMGEFEAASVLVGYLLESGRVTDPHEKRFLLEKLESLGDL